MWNPFSRGRGDAPERERRAPVFGRPAVAGAAAPIGHDSVRAADPYSFEVAHRRLAWIFRVSAMLNVGLIGVAIVEASAISTLVPLQKIQIGLVRIVPQSAGVEKVDPADRVRIEPITRQTAGFDLLMTAFVRNYVQTVLEIDATSQDDRMRRANLYSDKTWWKKFTDTRAKDIRAAADGGLNRSIAVETAEKISRANADPAIYAVDFVQTDVRDGKTVETRQLRAYVSVTSRPQTVREAEQYENPLGLRVLDMSVKFRGNS